MLEWIAAGALQKKKKAIKNRAKTVKKRIVGKHQPRHYVIVPPSLTGPNLRICQWYETSLGRFSWAISEIGVFFDTQKNFFLL